MSATSTPDLTNLLRQQESLRGIIESISSELELRPLLTLIVRHACELLDAENGTIGLLDEQRQIISTEAVWSMPASMNSGRNFLLAWAFLATFCFIRKRLSSSAMVTYLSPPNLPSSTIP